LPLEWPCGVDQQAYTVVLQDLRKPLAVHIHRHTLRALWQLSGKGCSPRTIAPGHQQFNAVITAQSAADARPEISIPPQNHDFHYLFILASAI
jgi:hypothetical protein